MPAIKRNPHYGWLPDYTGLGFALDAWARDAAALPADDRALLAWKLRELAAQVAAGQVEAPASNEQGS